MKRSGSRLRPRCRSTFPPTAGGQKKGGIGLIEPGKSGVRMLQWGDAEYPQLIKAKSADVYLFTRENTTDCPNYYSKITDANP